MVPTYEQMGDWLEEIAGGFPDAFFLDLDGGIQLEERALPDPDFPPGEMYIMGEYTAPLPPCCRRRTRRDGRTRSLPPWPTSSPTIWRKLPASTPWTTRTRSF